MEEDGYRSNSRYHDHDIYSRTVVGTDVVAGRKCWRVAISEPVRRCQRADASLTTPRAFPSQLSKCWHRRASLSTSVHPASWSRTRVSFRCYCFTGLNIQTQLGGLTGCGLSKATYLQRWNLCLPCSTSLRGISSLHQAARHAVAALVPQLSCPCLDLGARWLCRRSSLIYSREASA